MLERLQSLPLIVILTGIGATSMLVPAVFGYLHGEMHSARVFLYSSLIFLVLTAMLGIATSNKVQRKVVRSHLLAMLAAYVVLPLMLAVPFTEAVRDTRFINAYFEMVSSLTTTGATLFDRPGRVPDTVHLWRALVGWLGGFMMWVSAIAIFAPLSLGGFEVTARGRVGGRGARIGRPGPMSDPSTRLLRHAAELLPIYSGLTIALWIFLVIVGQNAFVAACHAMSTLATSGISPLQDLSQAGGGHAGEALIFVFLFFAISRKTFAPDAQAKGFLDLFNDPEFRMGLSCAILIPLVLFLRHWVGAYEFDEEKNITAALSALWGAAFTVLSFLSTTGFESGDWAASRDWSGLQTPGLLLVGVALIGGGVATTAGGVKLLRVYALYKHGAREMERLIHPSSVGGSGAAARHMRNQGAFMAWLFFMLFAISIAIIMGALSLAGVAFDDGIVLTIASLSTTGPLAGIAADPGISYAGLGDAAKMIIAAAMVIGRLETLAIIALLSPDFWRG